MKNKAEFQREKLSTLGCYRACSVTEVKQAVCRLAEL